MEDRPVQESAKNCPDGIASIARPYITPDQNVADSHNTGFLERTKLYTSKFPYIQPLHILKVIKITLQEQEYQQLLLSHARWQQVTVI